nr:MAG TPA: hypothetical protein [Caudoviricetes sp.]DAR22080.1 MAG TPA: hypothetical protein [Caudoviricetes sp.]
MVCSLMLKRTLATAYRTLITSVTYPKNARKRPTN